MSAPHLALTPTTLTEPGFRGLVRVLGGPATGKTRALIDTAAARIAGGVEPESVLLLTGSAGLGAQARAVITSALLRAGSRAVVREPLVRTVHSYAFAVLRLAAHHAHDELRRIWRREMITGAYVPTWVCAHTAAGPLRALAFRADPRNDAYACLDEAQVVQTLREASGLLGSCADYLQRTRAGLASRGIVDATLERLQRQVDGPAS